MKRCPECNRTFSDDSLRFCLYDSRPLVEAREAKPPAFTYGTPQAARKPVPWRWIIRGVIAGAFLLRLGMHYAHHTSTPPAPDAGVQSSLNAAIRQADDAEVQAFQQDDPAPLYPAYTGQALTGEVNSVQALKSAGTTKEDRLLSQSFTAYRVAPDHSEAQVDVTETWSSTTYSAPGHQVVGTVPSQVVPQTVFLKPGGSGWIVDKIQTSSQSGASQ